MKYRVRIVLIPSKTGGYTAYIPALLGCISEGDTMRQALFNIKEAQDLYLEDDEPKPPDDDSQEPGA